MMSAVEAACETGPPAFQTLIQGTRHECTVIPKEGWQTYLITGTQDLKGLCWARRHLSQVQPQQEVFGAGVASVAADVAAAALHRRFAAPASAGVAELAAAAFRPGGPIRCRLLAILHC